MNAGDGTMKHPPRKSAGPNPAPPSPEVPEEFGEECGGKGGVPYQTVARPPARITRVTVWHRQFVDGIQLETDLGVLPRIGGTGKHRDVHVNAFELEPGEFLTGVSVEYWSYIDRITFHTNKRAHGPFGGPDGQLKKTLMALPGRAVMGFKGRHWEVVDSIQLMISPAADKGPPAT
jgi:hypothetical protein